MKNNQLTGILVGALLVSALASAGIVFEYDSLFRRSRVLQSQLSEMQQASVVMQQLVNETAEFAKTSGSKELQALLNTPVGTRNHNIAPAKPSK